MRVVNFLGTVGLDNFCNGTSAFARDVIQGLEGRGCRVRFFSPSDLKSNSFISSFFRKARWRVLDFTMRHRLDVFFVCNLMLTFFSFYFFLRKKNLNNLFFCNDVLCAQVALLLSKEDVFLVTHFIAPPWDEFVRGGYIERNSFGYRMLRKWMLSIFNNKRIKYIFVSEATKSLVSQFVKHNNLCGEVIYNGITVECLGKSSLGHLAGKKYIINVGALCPNKNQERFIKIAAVLSRKDPNLYFVLVGDGDQSYRSRLVVFKGLLNKEETHEAISMAELYFHTSLVDNTPRVLIESMAYGVVTCCIEYGHAYEIIGKDSSLIFSVNEGDTPIADKIYQLLINSQVMGFKRAEQSKCFSEKFSSEKMIDSINGYLFNNKHR